MKKKAGSVRTFLVACHNGKARINQYNEIAEYLNSNRVELLHPITKSGKQAKLDRYGYKTGIYKEFYTNADACEYYEWLVSAVSDTTKENISEETIKKAIDQLFHFIHILQSADHLEIDERVQMIAPYDWQKLFRSFDMELVDIKNTVDRHDKEIVNILKLVLDMLKKNITFLEAQQKDYEAVFAPEKISEGKPQ